MTDLRKIDALVAEHVMRWGYTAEPGVFCPFDGGLRGDFCPSSDIAAAWEVVEKLRAEGWRCSIDLEYPGETTVEVEYGEEGDKFHMGRFYIAAETTPLAISRAALRAKGVDFSALGLEP